MTAVRLTGASALITVLLLVTITTPPASAAPAQPQAKFTWGIVTGTIYLNKRETAYVSLGAGAATTFASALPPPFNLLVSGAAALLSAYAGKAVIDGKCMKVKLSTVPFVPSVQPGTYGPKDRKFGRYCR
ncbi:MAG: hypothetical protein WDZ34_02420 [Candidatus Saccharimonadales bacterium]